jgi:hypothetical protein
VRPFGDGLATWVAEAPGFNLHKVSTPMRLESHGNGFPGASVLEQWEWYSNLTKLGKPVEYVFLPEADHLLVKPWERQVSQEGAVDWFRFWLTGEEDPAPAKREQYARWRELRQRQCQQTAGAASLTQPPMCQPKT